MAIAVADVRSRFPIAQDLPEAAIAAQLKVVTSIYCHPDAIPADFLDEATLQCTAHFLTLEVMQQAIISGISAGVAKGESPAIPTLNQKHWELTVYGLQFRELLDTVPTDNTTYLR